MRGRLPVGAALLAVLLSVPACATMGGVLGGRDDDFYGEVRSVDARRGYLEVRQDYGRTWTLRVDGRTRVTYGGRNYSVGSLRRGDEVRVRVAYDRYNQPWAERVELRREVRGAGSIWGTGSGMRVERWSGTVQQVDYRRGWFVLDRGRYSDARVYVGRATRDSDVRRFERLRRGQRVQVEVRTSYRGEAELVRFR